MFERLFDFIVSIWTALCPWFVVPQYEDAVVLRLGRFHREVDTGLRWRWPFFEEAMTCGNVYTTSDLSNQTLVTSDGKVVTLSAAYRHRVSNARVFLLETADAEQAVQDVIQIAIAEIVRDTPWGEVNAKQFWVKVTKRAAKESAKWGVRITKVGYTDLAKIRVLRLLVDQQSFTLNDE